MSRSKAIPSRRNRQGASWAWIAVGIGAGLLVTLLVGIGVHYLSGRRGADPRTRQVQELIEEAERLLAQGRKAEAARRKEE